MTTVEQSEPVRTSFETERACTDFLYAEVELLDDNDYSAWLDTCVSKDLVYLIPTRTTRQRASGISEFSTKGYHVRDSYAGMRLRVNRLATEHAYAEDPPSRTRRFVTNIRVRAVSDTEAEVNSNILVHRSQGDTADYDLIAAGRRDVLRIEEGQWRLLRRVVLLNHTILPTPNLGIVF
ncbi:aromatic-ring-hydroxylating dioxygenase subunit beta [Mycobacterium sp. DBP42]|jgi:3-phenylpropionate/cinnamic acid dioxygenase small subunit|uniref:aromatic-ring-hydroxylating dioxygenase subunit beta n=1 Tax=Mycobacterium sp. DBP42 TaxID=2545267 RepID=UPI00110D23CD|nr:aromatic-ring-hydroxylating dioxygenase subunit beta [Mycobacterium sp. DBP42]TMS52448.1 3-phenylpropionate/cinnamic acid dioxygenase subunit beta [Mycobacterium sp. DBP42]